MDKNAIKKYAIWARRELIERVTQRAWRYEVKEDAPQAGLTAIEGRVLEPVAWLPGRDGGGRLHVV